MMATSNLELENVGPRNHAAGPASTLESVASRLSALGPAGPAPKDLGPWSAERVGRNTVWRLANRSDPSECYFAKFYGSTLDYRRELAGLQLAERLAKGPDWLMAAVIPIANESKRLVVTRALPGLPLRNLARRALRRDQSRSVRRPAMEALEHSLSLVQDWIGLLQSEPMPPLELLQDDRPASVVERIADKLERLQSLAPSAGLRLDLPSGFRPRLPDEAIQEPVLIHGDLSFGNVFYHEGRIGVVDFENLGIGATFRDRIWIRYILEQCNFRWTYHKSTRLLDRLEAPDPEDQIAALYRLEFVIDHLLILAARRTARPWSERVLGANESRWVCREFKRLLRIIEGD